MKTRYRHLLRGLLLLATVGAMLGAALLLQGEKPWQAVRSTATPFAPETLAAAAGPPTRTPATRTTAAVVTATATPLSPTPTGTTVPAPTRTPAPTATPAYRIHEVAAEETLGGIAVRYGVTVDALVEINNLSNPNLLTLGQRLRIPPPMALPPIAGATRDYGYTILGFSVEGRAIEAFSFGNGPQQVVFVGGMHGGYEWNTVLLAYEMIDYFNGNRDQIPDAVTLHVIPVANPDGLYRVTGVDGRFTAAQVTGDTKPGRFNGRFVDLNRNWSCNWSTTALWGSTRVDPGEAPFSEPETRALRDYFLKLAPQAVLFWHSAANLVSPGRCDGSQPGAELLARTYGEAAGYPPSPFTAYDLTGSASDWLVSQGIPAAAVELITHEYTESSRNLAGMLAVLALYGTVEDGVEGR